MGFGGIESVSHRADGLLRLTDDGITLEWAEVQTVEQVGFKGVGSDVIELPAEWLELPIERLGGAWLLGGWRLAWNCRRATSRTSPECPARAARRSA